MIQTALKQQNKQIDFNLPAPYSNDVWDILNWDIYINSSVSDKNAWIARSNVMNNTMDFTLCDCLLVKEESKYYCYYLLNQKGIGLRSFAEYTDRFKLLFRYVNKYNISSILDINIDDYRGYIIQSNHKAIINNGSSVVGKEIVQAKKQNKLISFVSTFQYIIRSYIDSFKQLYERDLWKGKDIAHPNDTDYANLYFVNIHQEPMKKCIKEFIRFKLSSVKPKTAQRCLERLKIFCIWMYEYDESIEIFKNITRDILEDYFCFLRVESDLSQREINACIYELSCLFEWALINEDKRFPSDILFLPDDYCFKTVRRSNFYCDDDIQTIFKELVPCLPKVYGRIILMLHHTGMRIGEVLKLSIHSLKYINEQPYLSLYMYKTSRYNDIPIDGYIYDLLIKEIQRTQKKFPSSKYIFVNSKGNPFNYAGFIQNIKAEIIKHNILDSNGELLDFRTHRFRATKATKMINMGMNPKEAASMLGQKSLSSLSYYAVATNQALNEQMQEYLRKESLLINSIGQMDKLALENYDDVIPLCNGYCCRPADLGVCPKLNACLTCSLFKPSTQFLLNYKMQLTDVIASLAIAEENNYTRMAEKCREDKAALEDIIKKLEDKLNEQKT